MNLTLIIIIGMIVLSVIAPVISFYAVSLIKKQKYRSHIRIQKRLFGICVAAVLLLEIQIRISGGSGSLVSNGKYTGTLFFKTILTAHIIGAVLTYIIWGINVYLSNKKWRKHKRLSGEFSGTHRILGYITIAGLIYTAISAMIVCTLAFLL